MDALHRFIEFLDGKRGRQAAVADRAGVSDAYISQIKRQQHRPSPAVVDAASFEMSAAGCFDGELDRLRFEIGFRNMTALGKPTEVPARTGT